ncbi:MAG: PhoH family protein [Methanogenium sp.]|jgi:phosphate starvation-inducible protein PhoH
MSKIKKPITIQPLKPKTRNQAQYLDLIKKKKLVICVGPAGSGKAQPLNSIVYTINGPITIDNIQIGEQIYDDMGNLTTITNKFYQGQKDIYKVFFNDDTFVECCLDHLWEVIDSGSDNRIKIVDTRYILNNLYRSNSNSNRFHIKVTKPVNFNHINVDIDPYILGCLIGDGHLSKHMVTLSTADDEILNEFKKYFGKDNIRPGSKYGYRIVKNLWINKTLQKYGLYNTRSYNKFIPNEYKYNSIDVRLDILRGLFDTDGTMCNYKIEYATSSEKLANDVQEIVESLGGVCKIVSRTPQYIHKGIKYNGRLSYRCYVKLENFQLFRLTRKQKQLKQYKKYFTKRVIKDIRYSRTVDAVCIKIDNNSNLYLTNHFVPTHNTSLCSRYGIAEVLKENFDKIIITRPMVQAGEETGFLPGNIQEKLNPYLVPIFDEFKISGLSCEDIRKLIYENKIEICPIAYARGRNWHNSFIVLDEASNCTYEQLILIMTRLGRNSKLIINGDPLQSDLPKNKRVDLKKFGEFLAEIEDVGFVELNNEDIIREEIVSEILEKLEEWK